MESCIRYNSNGYVQLYYDGKWNNWLDSKTTEDDVYTQYLYYKGTNYTDICGNWEPYAYRASGSSNSTKAPTVTMGSSYMTLKQPGETGAGLHGSVWSQYSIDLTNYNYIEINYTTTLSVSTATCSLRLSPTKQNNYTHLTALSTGMKSTSNTTATVDISGVTGKYYILFAMYYCSTKIYSIKLIR